MGAFAGRGEPTERSPRLPAGRPLVLTLCGPLLLGRQYRPGWALSEATVVRGELRLPRACRAPQGAQRAPPTPNAASGSVRTFAGRALARLTRLRKPSARFLLAFSFRRAFLYVLDRLGVSSPSAWLVSGAPNTGGCAPLTADKSASQGAGGWTPPRSETKDRCPGLGRCVRLALGPGPGPRRHRRGRQGGWGALCQRDGTSGNQTCRHMHPGTCPSPQREAPGYCLL